jgi:BlaI family transcriptional regulator, penicillinase repressor
MHLTKAEEQVMLILWEMGEGIVKEIREQFKNPKPARNTVSTVIRVLEKKGFVGHKAFSNIHLYYPLIKKSEYSKSLLFALIENYFDNSFPAMVSFYVREKDLSIREMEDLLADTKKAMKKKKKNKK